MAYVMQGLDFCSHWGPIKFLRSRYGHLRNARNAVSTSASIPRALRITRRRF